MNKTQTFNIGGANFAKPLGRTPKISISLADLTLEELARRLDTSTDYILIKLKRTFADAPNTYEEIGGITIEEQRVFKDGELQPEDQDNPLFAFNDATKRLEYSGEALNLISVEFFDTFVIRRNSGSAQVSDAAKSFAVNSLFDVQGQIIKRVQIQESVYDTYNIPQGNTFELRRSYKDITIPTLVPEIKLGWELQDNGAVDMQLKELDVIIKVNIRSGE